MKLTAHGAAAASMHLRYIQRDGVERDGSPGALYGPEGPVPAETFEQPRVGEAHQFRFIVSPEDAAELDLTDYVRRLMRRMEKDLGVPLEWAAVNHYNTDHPHAHVVIRGVDRRGREVRFDREYIARGVRERAQEIATEELGPRSPEDIRRSRHREITQERFTSLDQELERRARENRLTREALEKPTRLGSASLPLIARLEHLEQMRLADRADPSTWALEPDWKQRLRELGERNDIVKQMHAAVKGDPSRYRTLRRGEALDPDPTAGKPGRPIVGRIRAKVLTDELQGTFSAIVETPAGIAYHVPLDPRTAATCRVGDPVMMTSVPRSRVRPEDATLEQLGAGDGGRCAPPQEHPEQAALARRLRQLEKLGLARPEGPGAWRLEPGLGAALERLDRERPEFRLVLRADPRSIAAQVAVRGPVWLDAVDAASLAPYGLGAELRPFVEERARTLRSLGIDPKDAKRIPKLRELERRGAGEREAAAHGLAFLPQPPDGFRGRVFALRDAPAYLGITDGERLVVLPAARDLRAHLGRPVILSREPSGRLRVAPYDLDRGR